MWRRLSSQLQPCLRSARSVSSLSSKTTTPRFLIAPSSSSSSTTPSISSNLFQRNFSAQPDSVLDKGKKIEDVMPIATGHEKEELEALLAGRDLAEMDHPVGPFGTKGGSYRGWNLKLGEGTGWRGEEPAVIKSIYDKRIVGCPGGEGEDEHDVVWFWLEKGKPHECPVCTQYFVLEVVGPGGPPDGHGDNHH